MLKRIFALILAVLLLLSGCNGTKESLESSEPESKPQESVQQENTQREDTPSPAQSELYTYLAENFPATDGSTSLIPLDAGIRAEIFGISIEEAQKTVAHSTTWGSFDNLLKGEADIIFSTPISEEQQKAAEEAEIKLEQVPVVREAFVFLVNAENPVDTLSQQQLKDIYSGKITNWSELGGNDEPITAFQRNNDSGSQNYMIDFMGETKLMDAPTELRPGSMGGLVDAIAPNDGAEGSIGYSVYAYAADMHGGNGNIKFIKVDGPAPTKETIISGEYPLSSYNYAIFRADEPKDGAVRRLAEFMTSYDGQLAAAKAGYATLNDIGFDYSGSTLKKYEASGTGMKYPGSVPSYEYKTSFYEKWDYGDTFFTVLNGEPRQNEDGSYDAYFICNKELRREVSEFITDAAKTVSAEEENMNKLIEEENKLYNYYGESDFGRFVSQGVRTYITAKNGYLSVSVSLMYMDNVQDCYDRYYKSETAVWDLVTGKRLSPEELFYEGVDIAEELNKLISERSSRAEDYFIGEYKVKRNFDGLTEKGWHITADSIYFDRDNPYFEHGYEFSLKDLPEGVMVTEQPRPAGQTLRMTEEIRNLREIQTTVYHARDTKDDFYVYELLYEDSYPGAKKINEAVESYLSEYASKDAVRKYYAEKGVDIDDTESVSFEMGSGDCYLSDYGGKYIYFSGGYYYLYSDKTESEYQYPYSRSMFFDAQTGEEIGFEGLLSEDWRKYAEFDGSFDENTKYSFGNLYASMGKAHLSLYGNDEFCEIILPESCVKW